MFNNFVLNKKRIHDAPWLQINNFEVLNKFLIKYQINFYNINTNDLLLQFAKSFKNMPFENLTKILKSSQVISAESAMRYPDEVIADHLKFGTGGTCFSLSATFVAILDIFGIKAYPILADRHYGPNTHCGLMVLGEDNSFYILDPGYLLFAPVKISPEKPIYIDTEFNRVELIPQDSGKKIELYTSVKGNRKLRLTFKIEPVSDEAFKKAWVDSFAFEMMSYPVVTRVFNGSHQYMQGNLFAERTATSTKRIELHLEKQIEFLVKNIGINENIVKRSLEIVKNG